MSFSQFSIKTRENEQTHKIHIKVSKKNHRQCPISAKQHLCSRTPQVKFVWTSISRQIFHLTLNEKLDLHFKKLISPVGLHAELINKQLHG